MFLSYDFELSAFPWKIIVSCAQFTFSIACNGFDHEPDVVNLVDAIDDAITPKNIERFRNCTVVKGSLKFLSSTFTG